MKIRNSIFAEWFLCSLFLRRRAFQTFLWGCSLYLFVRIRSFVCFIVWINCIDVQLFLKHILIKRYSLYPIRLHLYCILWTLCLYRLLMNRLELLVTLDISTHGRGTLWFWIWDYIRSSFFRLETLRSLLSLTKRLFFICRCCWCLYNLSHLRNNIRTITRCYNRLLSI